jgi:hypothetical protein
VSPSLDRHVSRVPFPVRPVAPGGEQNAPARTTRVAGGATGAFTTGGSSGLGTTAGRSVNGLGVVRDGDGLRDGVGDGAVVRDAGAVADTRTAGGVARPTSGVAPVAEQPASAPATTTREINLGINGGPSGSRR